jgi:hypothetical protein
MLQLLSLLMWSIAWVSLLDYLVSPGHSGAAQGIAKLCSCRCSQLPPAKRRLTSLPPGLLPTQPFRFSCEGGPPPGSL